MERRLAAILATDVVGYSRLIRTGEEGTLVALKNVRSDPIDPKTAEHRGGSSSRWAMACWRSPQASWTPCAPPM